MGQFQEDDLPLQPHFAVYHPSIFFNESRFYFVRPFLGNTFFRRCALFAVEYEACLRRASATIFLLVTNPFTHRNTFFFFKKGLSRRTPSWLLDETYFLSGQLQQRACLLCRPARSDVRSRRRPNYFFFLKY